MATLEKIIFLNSGGFRQVIIPMTQSTLLGNQPNFPAESFISLTNLIYQGHLPKEKMNLYFPTDRSWVIFELKGEGGPFLLSFGLQRGKLASFFLNGTYEEEIFVEEENFRNAKEVMSFVQSHQWDHSPYLMHRDDYQQILWGQAKGGADSKLHRFTWSNEKDYGPLQDLLDSFQDMKPISKDLILNVLSTNLPLSKKEINLKVLRDQLADFQKSWKAFKLLEKQSPLQKEFIRDFQAYGKLKETQNHLLQELAAQSSQEQERKKELLHMQVANKKALNLLQKEIQEAESTFKQEQQHKIKQLGYFQQLLTMAQDKKVLYPKKRSNKKKTANQETTAETKEKMLLRDRWINQEIQALQKSFIGQFNSLHEKFLEKELSSRQEQEQLSKELLSIQRQSLTLKASLQEKPTAVPSFIMEDNEEMDEVRMSHFQELIDQTEKQRELEIALIQANREKEEIRFQASVRPFEDRIGQLNAWLENKSNSFYGWLENRYPGWQKTIGKVVKEDVLFQPNLNPNVVRLNDLLYGIQLSISEISRQAPGLEELNQERQELRNEIEKRRQKFEDFLSDNQKQLQNCEKRYRQRFKQLRTALQDIQIRSEQAELKKKKLEAEGKLNRQLQNQESQQRLLRLEYQRADLEKKLEDGVLNLHHDQQEFLQQVEEARQSLQNQLERLESLYEPSEGDSFESPEVDWDVYWQDQIHYISKIPFFEDQIKQINKELQLSATDREETVKKELQRFETIETDILKANEELEKLDQALDKWAQIQPAYEAKVEESSQEKRAEKQNLYVLFSKYQNILEEEKRRLAQLMVQGKSFIAPFEEGNLFKMPSSLENEKDLKALSGLLENLQGETLETVKNQIGQNYSSLLSLVSEQLKVLQDFPTQLQQEVDRFNEILSHLDFERFALSIELQASPKPVFQVLNQINAFVKEQGNQLGGVSLFNPLPDSDANQQALDLLEKLAAQLVELPQKSLSLHQSQEISTYWIKPEGKKVELEERALSQTQQSWERASMLTSCLVFLREKKKKLPTCVFIPDLDVYGRAFAMKWMMFLQEENFQVLSSSQWGTAAQAFGAVLIWKEDDWLNLKKN